MTLMHDFWLLREGEQSYAEYTDYSGRRDAPLCIGDDVLEYCADALAWVPSLNPARHEEEGCGLNRWGVTVITQRGGGLWHDIFAAYAQLFRCGPARLDLRGSFLWQWPFAQSRHLLHEEDIEKLGQYEHLFLDRDTLVDQMLTLARFGEQTAGGAFFILHCGI